jgi:hypothetical protein
MGVATLVSIIPTLVLERKPGLSPNQFVIFPVKENDFELLPVPDCQYAIYLDGDRGSILAYKAGEDVADSIVRDYIDSKPNVNPSAHPGIAWVPGDYENQKEKFKKDHQILLDSLYKTQNAWFAAIVAIADDEWERHRSHRAISDEQRLAAKRLGLTDRPYIISIPESRMTSCPGCATSISAKAILCPNCHTILNEEGYSKLKRAVPAIATP